MAATPTRLLRCAERAYLDRRPTGDRSLAPPRKCIIQISGFQHPKTAYEPLIRRFGSIVLRASREQTGGCITFPLAITIPFAYLTGYYALRGNCYTLAGRERMIFLPTQN